MLTWFIPDLISVIPFEFAVTSVSVNRVARFIRVGKISRLIRMARIVRYAKMGRVKNTIIRNIKDKIKISVGVERLAFILVMTIILVHIVSCIWYVLISTSINLVD